MSEQGAKILSWVPPEVNGPVVGSRRKLEDLSAIEREAWERGFAIGREAGTAAVQQEQQRMLADMAQRVRRLDAILEYMGKPLHDLDAAVQEQLAGLAGAIARALIRRELKTQPGQIVAVIRDTVALLPASAREVRVHLHPEDAALVRESLAETTTDRAWTIAEDPVLSRGGCRVTSDNSTIDARIETRLGAAIAAALGDERQSATGSSS
ncbi:MAG: flagellar assembly protein FliH [Steroidobacteraceae bacterium]|jgi:flagellar assembly protein FliH